MRAPVLLPGLAWIALFIERLVRPLVHAFLVGGLFIAIALSGVFGRLSFWPHLVLLLAFAAVFIFLLVRDFSRLVLPGHREALRRLETDSGLAHQPLSALEDSPALGRLDLWDLHLARMREAAKRLKPCFPHPQAAAIDPFGLRFIVLLALIFAGIASRGEWKPRLMASLLPEWAGRAAKTAPVEAWLIAPAFTGLPPTALPSDGQTARHFETPMGSVLKVRLPQALAAHAVLAVEARELAFTPAPDGTATLSVLIDAPETITLSRRFRTLAKWQFSISADSPPVLIWQEAPSATAQHALKLSFKATDDWGLAAMAFRVARNGRMQEYPLPLPGRRPKTAEGPFFPDLTAHEWAGEDVSITLMARDGRGQESLSEGKTLKLPERSFSHPVAKAIIGVRKSLLQKGDAARQNARERLRELVIHPGDFGGDITVFLALRTTDMRLGFDTRPRVIADVADTLWKTALRLEDGGLALALQNLEAARQALSEALADPESTDAEIRALLDQLAQAMANYLETLARNMQEGMMPFMPPGTQSLSLDDLAGALQNISDMAETGARDAAQKMLDELSNLLQGLSMQKMSADAQRFWKTLEDIEKMAGQQNALLDRTFRGSPDQMAKLGKEQKKLREDYEKALAALRDMLGGSLPEGFEAADGDMLDAEGALGQKDGEGAQGAQGQALANMKKGMDGLMQQMMAGGKGSGMGMMRPGGRDPFGRKPGGNGLFSERIGIPQESDINRSLKIIEDLRKRASELQRPQPERDYLGRLLKRF